MLSPTVLCYEVIIIAITNVISFTLKNFSEAEVITSILQIKKKIEAQSGKDMCQNTKIHRA